MFQLQQIENTGSSEAFMGRLFKSVLDCRNSVLTHLYPPAISQAKTLQFDQVYQPAFDALKASHEASKSLLDQINAHRQKAASGNLYRKERQVLHISESIDGDLKKKMADVHIQGVIGLKNLQAFYNFFGQEIGFFFQKQQAFEKGIQDLRARGEAAFADFLVASRKTWTQDFIHQRIEIEHTGWTLPRIKYLEHLTGNISMILPTLKNSPIDDYIRITGNRLPILAETLIFYAMQSAVKPTAWIKELMPSEMNLGKKERFRFWHSAMGFYNPFPWQPKYQETTEFLQ